MLLFMEKCFEFPVMKYEKIYSCGKGLEGYLKWKEMFDVNVLGLSLCTQEAISQMIKNNITGHIVNISSMSGHRLG